MPWIDGDRIKLLQAYEEVGETPVDLVKARMAWDMSKAILDKLWEFNKIMTVEMGGVMTYHARIEVIVPKTPCPLTDAQ